MLAIDIGNTCIRFAAFKGADLLAGRALPTRGIGRGEIEKALAGLLPLSGAREAWIASVAPLANPAVEAAADA